MTIEELHDKAMEYTDLALISKQRGNSQESLIYFGEALKYEEKAVSEAIKQDLGSLTVGVLLRSAATLALDKNDTDKLLFFTRKALVANIPSEVRIEFKQLLENSGIRNIQFNLESVDRIIARRKILQSTRKIEAINLKKKLQSKTNRRIFHLSRKNSAVH